MDDIYEMVTASLHERLDVAQLNEPAYNFSKGQGYSGIWKREKTRNGLRALVYGSSIPLNRMMKYVIKH